MNKWLTTNSVSQNPLVADWPLGYVGEGSCAIQIWVQQWLFLEQAALNLGVALCIFLVKAMALRPLTYSGHWLQLWGAAWMSVSPCLLNELSPGNSYRPLYLRLLYTESPSTSSPLSQSSIFRYRVSSFLPLSPQSPKVSLPYQVRPLHLCLGSVLLSCTQDLSYYLSPSSCPFQSLFPESFSST